MKRIRVDLMFAVDSDGDEVWVKLKDYLKTKDIRSLVNEKSYIDYHECTHDINQPCIPIERFEK